MHTKDSLKVCLRYDRIIWVPKFSLELLCTQQLIEQLELLRLVRPNSGYV